MRFLPFFTGQIKILMTSDIYSAISLKQRDMRPAKYVRHNEVSLCLKNGKSVVRRCHRFYGNGLPVSGKPFP